MDGKDPGITGDIPSLLTPKRSETQIECFQGGPYTCTSFLNDIIIDGEWIRAAGRSPASMGKTTYRAAIGSTITV